MIIFLLLSLCAVLLTVYWIAAPLIAPAPEGRRVARMSALGAVAVTPLLVGLIYWSVGSPAALNPEAHARTVADPETAAAAIAALPASERNAMIENMVAGLAARLEAEPNDLDGWRMLGRSYAAMERFDESAAAFMKAVGLSDGDIIDWRSVMESRLRARTDETAPLSAETLAAVEAVYARNENDPSALYFLGLKARDEGDTAKARELWSRLRAQMPDEAPFAVEFDELIAALEGPASSQ